MGSYKSQDFSERSAVKFLVAQINAIMMCLEVSEWSTMSCELSWEAQAPDPWCGQKTEANQKKQMKFGSFTGNALTLFAFWSCGFIFSDVAQNSKKQKS